MKNKFIHLVPHTHWDREWYFTSSKAKIYLINDMKEIMDMLESNPDYPCYVLDGQTVCLEDYLSAVPEDKERIIKLVKDNRLKIGPWYTQTDEMVVGGESIVRNLLYGKIDCEKFGQRMMIGYLPDSFGQTASMPKILNGFGIKKSVFWRGFSQRLNIDQTEFNWFSDDGSKVVVQLLPAGYSVGITIPNDVEKIHKQLDWFIKTLTESSTTNHICIPNGHDQMPVQQNIFEIIDILKEEYPDYEIKLSSYDEFFDYIDTEKIKNINGELFDGKYARVHRTISSSRADLKTMNTQLENAITNILEPIASVAYSLGFEYQSGTLEEAWRNLLKNQAHDSIGCCCTDAVNKDVKRRFEKSRDLIDNLTEFYMRKIIESVPQDGDKLIVFNTLPQDRKDSFLIDVNTKYKNFDIIDKDNNLLDFEIIDKDVYATRDESNKEIDDFIKYKIVINDKIPAMGYKIYKIVKSDINNFIKESFDNILENKFYKIEIKENGSLKILDKINNKTYDDVLIFEDSADVGDSYDYSPAENDWIIKSDDVKTNIKTYISKHIQMADVSFKWLVPKDINSRNLKDKDSYMDIKTHIQLEESEIIKLSIDIDNQAKDHRVRVLIPQNLSAKASISDNQFGKIKRDTYDKALDFWKEENWDERPDPIYPFLSYVSSDNKFGLATLSNSVREYEFINGKDKYDTLAITLFRAYAQHGQRDLIRRPGRVSGTYLPTPDAQLIGHNTYDIALTSNLENIDYLAKYYTTPAAFYSTNPSEDLLLNKTNIIAKQNYSLLSIEKSNIQLSSLKKIEIGEGLALRLFNTTDKEQILSIGSNINLKAELMLDETIKKELNGTEQIKFNPYEIKTFLLRQ